MKKNTDSESEYDVISKENKWLTEMEVSISKHRGKGVKKVHGQGKCR